MENSRRCFIALEIPMEIQKALVKVADLAHLNPLNGFRPVRTGMIHITLKFLGDTSETKLSQINEELTKIAVIQSPFTIKIRNLGAFASWDHPRTIWAGLDFPQELLTLFDHINHMAEQLGFVSDHRPFSPHLTFARVSDRADFSQVKQSIEILRQNSNLIFGEVRINQIILFESLLQRGGSIYTPISTHNFGGRKV